MNIQTAKIDVTKIDKSRLYKGQKGMYLDVVLIPTPQSEYGDFMVVQQVSKEERDKGIKGEILGNGKVMGGSKPESDPEPTGNTETNDDLPF